MNRDSLMMALLSTLSPPIGLLGSLVKAITSDEQDAGLSFVLDIASAGLSTGSMVGDFGLEVLKQMAVDSFSARDIRVATREVLPYSVLPAKCEKCGSTSQFYGRKQGVLICNECLAKDLSMYLSPNDQIYLLTKNTKNLHQLINNQNRTYLDYLTDKVNGQGVDITRTRDNRIPEFSYTYVNDDNIRWSISMWATLAAHWPIKNYLALFDFSHVSWRSIERASSSLTPEFKKQFHGKAYVSAKVAVVHQSFIGNHETGSADQYVTWGTFGHKADAYAWLYNHL